MENDEGQDFGGRLVVESVGHLSVAGGGAAALGLGLGLDLAYLLRVCCCELEGAVDLRNLLGRRVRATSSRILIIQSKASCCRVSRSSSV